MSARIIPFTRPPAEGEESPLSPVPGVLETALDMHGLIVKGLYDGVFGGGRVVRFKALQGLIENAYGPHLSAVAEGHFELVFGCDPLTFLEHALSYAPDWGRKAQPCKTAR